MDKLDNLIGQIGDLLKSAFTPKVEITKSLDQEQRRALFIVMEPEVFDAHGDITSAEEIEKACNNFNEHCMTANLFHLVETEAVKIQQSFIALSDMQTEGGRTITKGTWLMWMGFPETEEAENLWTMVKSNDINGVSIGAKGFREPIDE